MRCPGHPDLLQGMAALVSAWQVQALVLAEPAAGHSSFVVARFESVVRARGLSGTQGFRWPWCSVSSFEAETPPKDRLAVGLKST